MTDADLSKLSRDELDAKARRLGIDPAGLANKAAVIEAIEAASAARSSRTAQAASGVLFPRVGPAILGQRRRRRSGR